LAAIDWKPRVPRAIIGQLWHLVPSLIPGIQFRMLQPLAFTPMDGRMHAVAHKPPPAPINLSWERESQKHCAVDACEVNKWDNWVWDLCHLQVVHADRCQYRQAKLTRWLVSSFSLVLTMLVGRKLLQAPKWKRQQKQLHVVLQ
jgi:hypothetical protein